ncbi:MAG: hypothetical protein M3Q94_19625, partial [Pseudomonadota bacterium]|nr:hypothetical protein [Pseudomonadota bacterium]
GNTPITDREDSTTLIQQMEEFGQIYCAMAGEKKILHTMDGSIDFINSALYYDKTKKIGEYSEKMSGINHPQMLFTEDVPNMIWAVENWTGEDGTHGACKDPIDVIRGFVLSRLCYIGPEMLRVRGGGGSY